MIDLSAFLQFAKEFGLPLALVVFALVVIARRVFVTKAEMDERLKSDGAAAVLAATAAKADRDYVEARRVEERDARLRAEQVAGQTLDLLESQTTFIKDIQRELSRIGLFPPGGIT